MSGVHALVLAAGAGARFGGRKLLAPWRGGVLLDGALAAALAAPVDSVVVVTGADSEAVVQAVGGRARTVHAIDHDRGLSASLKAGLAALPLDAAGVVVFLGDMPFAPPDVVRRLVEAICAGAPAAAPFLDGRQGNPAAFSSALFAQVAAIGGDKGAREVLNRLGEGLVRIETDDPGVLIDVDRAGDMPD